MRPRKGISGWYLCTPLTGARKAWPGKAIPFRDGERHWADHVAVRQARTACAPVGTEPALPTSRLPTRRSEGLDVLEYARSCLWSGSHPCCFNSLRGLWRPRGAPRRCCSRRRRQRGGAALASFWLRSLLRSFRDNAEKTMNNRADHGAFVRNGH
jgi:hypothetical protein